MAVMAVMKMRVIIAVIGKMAMMVENAIMALRAARYSFCAMLCNYCHNCIVQSGFPWP